MEAFESFLSTTEHRARAEELFAMFNRKIDFVKTLTLATADYINVMDYMMASLDEFTITIFPSVVISNGCQLISSDTSTSRTPYF